jgi:HD-GYP domain-containing protein (c-di-GMP phosphodiesterase class II)
MKTENLQFTKLPIKDLAKKIICDGHLFLLSGERKFYVMKPGVFVDPDFIKKHAAANPTFEFSQVSNQELKESFRNLFRELRYLQFEKDLRLKCSDILKLFFTSFSNQEHFLSFALACHEEFCQLPLDDQRKMHETDMHLYRKALYSAAFAVITGMANDFYHYLMLKDFYNLTFALDIGLCESNYSYYVCEACNKENREPGTGLKLLESEKASDFEKKVFFNHPENSYKYIKATAFLSYPELAEVSLYQHELADGLGFPRGIQKSQVSSWEAVVMFADSLVEISAEYSFETDVINYMTNFQNQKLKDLPVSKVYKKLCGAFKHLDVLKETGS